MGNTKIAKAISVYDDAARIMAESGYSTVKITMIDAAWMKLRHAAKGCTKVPHWKIDHNSEKVVMVGRICPVCYTEYPIDD